MSDANRPLNDYSNEISGYGETTTKMRVLVDAKEGIPSPQNLFASKPLRSIGAFSHHDPQAKNITIQTRIGSEIGTKKSQEAREFDKSFLHAKYRLEVFEEKKTALFDLTTYNFLSSEYLKSLEQKGRDLEGKIAFVEEKIKASKTKKELDEAALFLGELELTLQALDRATKEEIRKTLAATETKKQKAEALVDELTKKSGDHEKGVMLYRKLLPIFEEYAFLKSKVTSDVGKEALKDLDQTKLQLESYPTEAGIALLSSKIEQLRKLVENESIPEKIKEVEVTPLPPKQPEIKITSDGWPNELFIIEKNGDKERWYLNVHGVKTEINNVFWSYEKANFEKVYEKYELFLANKNNEEYEELTRTKDEIIKAIQSNNLAHAAFFRQKLERDLEAFAQGEKPTIKVAREEVQIDPKEQALQKHLGLFNENATVYIEKYKGMVWQDGDPEKEASRTILNTYLQQLLQEEKDLKEHIESLSERLRIGAAQKGEPLEEEIKSFKQKLLVTQDSIRSVSGVDYAEKIAELKGKTRGQVLRGGNRITLSLTPSTTTSVTDTAQATEDEVRTSEITSQAKEIKPDPVVTPSTESVVESPQPSQAPEVVQEEYIKTIPITPIQTPEPLPPSEPMVAPTQEEPTPVPQQALKSEPTEPRSTEAVVNIPPKPEEKVVPIVVQSETSPQIAPTPTPAPQPVENRVESKEKKTASVKKLFETLGTRFKDNWRSWAVAALVGGSAGFAIGKNWPKEGMSVKSLQQLISWRDNVPSELQPFLTSVTTQKTNFETIISTHVPLYKIDPNNPDTRANISNMDINVLMNEPGSCYGLSPEQRTEICALIVNLHKLAIVSQQKNGVPAPYNILEWKVPNMRLEDFIAQSLKTVVEADTLEDRIKQMV